MSMRRRLGLATNISFFSFQDIITSVTGILILVTDSRDANGRPLRS